MKIISICLFCALMFSCSAFQRIEQKDTMGRVVRVAFYEGSILEHLKEIEYVGNSYNPSEVTYFKQVDSALVPFKRELYSYQINDIDSISVFSRENGKDGEEEILTGQLKFQYTELNKIESIEYYSYSPRIGLYMVGLDQYSYTEGSLAFQRIIEYQLNPEANRTIQKAQYQIHYSEGKLSSMKYGVIDSGSSTIIEKNDSDVESISAKLKSLEKFFLMKTLGRESIII